MWDGGGIATKSTRYARMGTAVASRVSHPVSAESLEEPTSKAYSLKSGCCSSACAANCSNSALRLRTWAASFT